MKVYMGFRVDGICRAYTWNAAYPDGPKPLEPRLDLWSHSPAGFEWGFDGSGPAQLALALAADLLDDDARAVAVHQAFSREFVAYISRDCWSVTADYLAAIISRLERYRKAREGVHHGD